MHNFHPQSTYNFIFWFLFTVISKIFWKGTEMACSWFLKGALECLFVISATITSSMKWCAASICLYIKNTAMNKQVNPETVIILSSHLRTVESCGLLCRVYFRPNYQRNHQLFSGCFFFSLYWDLGYTFAIYASSRSLFL